MATGSRSVANHTTGVADRYLATRDVPNDDTACSDHRVVPDSNPGADHAVTAYPYIASNVHGLRRFHDTLPDVGLRFSDTYSYSGLKVQLTFSCYLIRHGDDYMIWDTGNPATAGATAPKVTLVDMHAVIAGKWGAQLHPTPDSAQQFAQACVPSGGILVGNSIKSSQPSLRHGHCFLQFRVG